MMRKKGAILLLLLCSAIYLSGQTGLRAFLPDEKEMSSWTVSDKVDCYRGEDLIFFVNREADLYHEFGFVEAMDASFVNNMNDELGFELYRMKDVYASYGIYLHKTEGMEENFDAGKEARIDDSKIVVWKHHYVAVIAGDAKNERVRDAMYELAAIVDNRIKIPGRWPSITHTFRDAPGKVSLLRGKVSLQNVYYFTSKDVFRIEEGYAVEKPGMIDICLKYSDSFTTIRRFGEIAGVLSREKRFSHFRMVGDTAFRLVDEKGNDINIEADHNFLNISIRASIYSEPAARPD